MSKICIFDKIYAKIRIVVHIRSLTKFWLKICILLTALILTYIRNRLWPSFISPRFAKQLSTILLHFCTPRFSSILVSLFHNFFSSQNKMKKTRPRKWSKAFHYFKCLRKRLTAQDTFSLLTWIKLYCQALNKRKKLMSSMSSLFQCWKKLCQVYKARYWPCS